MKVDVNKYKWDIESLLQGKSLEDLFKKWETQYKKLIDIYPEFCKSIDNFKTWLKENEKLTILSNRLYNYISNSLNEDLANPELNGWMQKLTIKANEYAQTFSNYDNLVIKNKKVITEYLADKKLSEYTRMFELIFKSSKYLLDDKSEKLISKLSIYNGSIDDVYSTLTDNDLLFEDAINEKDKKVPLKTQADVFKNLKSKDNTLRKSTWLSFHKAFFNVRNTLTKSLYYNYLMLNTNAKIRGFEDYIHSTAYNDEIKVDFINKVYENVKLYKPLVNKFTETRSSILKKMYSLKKVEPWDNYLELSKQEKTYTIEQAQKIVLKALNILGEEYIEIVKKAFEENWISWLPNPNKQTGAYSIGGTKGLDKYFISMNFDSTLRSVYTLAHELGHSLHSYYFGKKQKVYQGCSIFYAEIASIANEMFLNNHLLKTSNDQELKLSILDEMISNFIATTTRQVIFSNFEYEANKMVNESIPFNYESISKLYFDTINQYMDTKIEYDKQPGSLSLVTPLRISHFYVGNFYVYKYAIGQIASIIIANRIINDPSQKDYLFKFLSSGNSLSPLDTIKLLGIDLTTEEPWLEAKEIFESWINEYISLAKELKYIK